MGRHQGNKTSRLEEESINFNILVMEISGPSNGVIHAGPLVDTIVRGKLRERTTFKGRSAQGT